MIRDIGRAVLNEAGRQLGIWQRAYRPAEPVFVAVNISSAQLIEPSLLDDVKLIINRENLQRGSFKIEVTESLQFPKKVIYSCMPISSAVMVLYSIKFIILGIIDIVKPENAEEKANQA